MSFFDRDDELAQLDAIASRDGAQFVVVFGRRRIGKTALLTRWMERTAGRKTLYWVAHRTSSELLLRGFCQAMAQTYAIPGGSSYSLGSWEAALQQLLVISATTPTIAVIDEFPYLVESGPQLPSLLQKLWDQHKAQAQLVLVLCGSHYQMMHQQLLSPHQPLFGRSTAALLVDEIPPQHLGLFLPRYSAEQRVETYSVIGGVPKYLELWDDRAPVAHNIEQLVLSPATLFRHEAMFLIQDEIAEPRTHLALLEALGAGLKSPATLARQTGIALNHIGKYLATLVALRFVRRVLSADVQRRRGSRITRYEIRDPFLRFHFNYIYRHPDLVEQNRFARLAQIIEADLARHVGSTGYEELARRHLTQLGDAGQLPFCPEYVGRAWDKDVEIDVVAIDWSSSNVLLGECRWRRSKLGLGDLQALRERGDKLRRLRGLRKHFALFSRAGFSAELRWRAGHDVHLFEGADMDRG